MKQGFLRILRFCNLCCYPKHLLPKTGDQIILRKDIIKECYLCRRVDDLNCLKDIEGRLSPNAITPEGEFFRLSTNLVPPTTPDDLKYKILNSQLGRYYSRESTIPKRNKIAFECIKSYGHFFFQIDQIQGYVDKIPFRASNKKFSDKDSTVFQYSIDHKPTLVNYHHYESSVNFNQEAQSLKPGNFNEGTYQAAILHKLRTKFRQISVFSVE